MTGYSGVVFLYWFSNLVVGLLGTAQPKGSFGFQYDTPIYARHGVGAPGYYALIDIMK